MSYHGGQDGKSKMQAEHKIKIELCDGAFFTKRI